MKLFKKKDKLQKATRALRKVLKKYKLIQITAVYNLYGEPFMINLLKRDITKEEQKILNKMQVAMDKLIASILRPISVRKKIVQEKESQIDA